MTKNSMTAIVVDDSAPLRQRLVEMLAAVEGFEVIGEAQNGIEALTAVHSLRPDVVILDIQMPGINGIDVLEAIKRDYPQTVVIMLTHHADSQYKERCFELNADYFLSKSTDSTLLVDIGERLIRTKGRRSDG